MSQKGSQPREYFDTLTSEGDSDLGTRADTRSRKGDRLACSSGKSSDGCGVPSGKAKTREQDQSDGFQFDADSSNRASARLAQSSRASGETTDFGATAQEISDLARQEALLKRPTSQQEASPLITIAIEQDPFKVDGGPRSGRMSLGSKETANSRQIEYKSLVKFQGGECIFQTIR